mmetsp:Transcript_53260/g.108668  ORF Transcript_53260/g.108668 Transcript_53260/m.108668 type:complete len:300 (+) Transcript_53260:153-1052(+)
MGCGASKQQKEVVAVSEQESSTPQEKKAAQDMTVTAQQPANVDTNITLQAAAQDLFQNLGLVSLTLSAPNWSETQSEELKEALAKDTGVAVSNICVLQYTKDSKVAQVVFHAKNWAEVCGKLESAVSNAESASSGQGVVACSGGTKSLIGKGAGVSRVEPAANNMEALPGAQQEEYEEKISDLEDKVSDLTFQLQESAKASQQYVDVLQEELKQQVEMLNEQVEDLKTEKDSLAFELTAAKKASEEYLAMVQEDADNEKEKREEKEWDLKQAQKAAEDYVAELTKEIEELKAKLKEKEG